MVLHCCACDQLTWVFGRWRGECCPWLTGHHFIFDAALPRPTGLAYPVPTLLVDMSKEVDCRLPTPHWTGVSSAHAARGYVQRGGLPASHAPLDWRIQCPRCSWICPKRWTAGFPRPTGLAYPVPTLLVDMSKEVDCR